MAILEEIATAVVNGDAAAVDALTRQALEQDFQPKQILDEGLVSGMNVVSERFKNSEIFIPEVLVSAKAMKAGMNQVRPLLAQANVTARGKVVIGTVRGDLHDIGKNIVGMLLEGAGFEVADLGADVTPEKFVETTREAGADIVGMSALLTTTMIQMKQTIEALAAAGLNQVKVMIGGAPVTRRFAEEIGADGYAPDAATAVDLADSLLKT